MAEDEFMFGAGATWGAWSRSRDSLAVAMVNGSSPPRRRP